ncbi:MAG: phosphoenolpyruvate carboxykinase (ATP), partial [Planctomycetes bacterium]|nr:phosphoenolpyruvate carboxykinase (ATP) [Planctomycetota bacterium]
IGGHPKNVVFLTCDAFGVLPPISRLTEEQAMYHFLSGYTAKVAGTEAGITEPQATFSSLFGAPFFTQKPMTYARMLADRLKQHGARCWLVNTGWTGGPYGVGQRMSLPHTRALLNAALGGALDNVEYTTGPVFGLKIPKSCPDVPAEVLVPQNTWNDKAAYQAKNKELAERFKENFKKFEGVPAEVLSAGPK